MSRNKDELKAEEKIIKFNNNKDDPKSNEDLYKNHNTKESLLDYKDDNIIQLKENSNESNDENIELKKIEKKYISIRNYIPDEYYFKMFDEKFMKFFENDEYLDKFEEIAKAVRNCVDMDEKGSILSEFRDKIYLNVLNDFNANAIRIYIDLKKFYNKFKDFKFFDKKFLEIFEKDENIEFFDKIYFNIKINLFKKAGSISTFSRMFFPDAEIKVLIFFNISYMQRIFINMKNNCKFNYSIINEKNLITKEMLYNVIEDIILRKIYYNKNKGSKDSEIIETLKKMTLMIFMNFY